MTPKDGAVMVDQGTGRQTDRQKPRETHDADREKGDRWEDIKRERGGETKRERQNF